MAMKWATRNRTYLRDLRSLVDRIAQNAEVLEARTNQLEEMNSRLETIKKIGCVARIIDKANACIRISRICSECFLEYIEHGTIEGKEVHDVEPKR